MNFWRSEAWRFRWLPLLTAVAGVVALFLMQDIPLLRRHALLFVLIAGMGFFVPALRHRLLILFAYGMSLYFLTKSIATWLDAPLGGLGDVDKTFWMVVGILMAVSAVGMGRRNPPRWSVSVLLVGLALYFASYTYAEYLLNNWLQVLAGAGLTLVALAQSAVNWVEAEASRSEGVSQQEAENPSRT